MKRSASLVFQRILASLVSLLFCMSLLGDNSINADNKPTLRSQFCDKDVEYKDRKDCFRAFRTFNYLTLEWVKEFDHKTREPGDLEYILDIAIKESERIEQECLRNFGSKKEDFKPIYVLGNSMASTYLSGLIHLSRIKGLLEIAAGETLGIGPELFSELIKGVAFVSTQRQQYFVEGELDQEKFQKEILYRTKVDIKEKLKELEAKNLEK